MEVRRISDFFPIMISFFPELRLDQLLFDAIGKFQSQANFPKSRTVNRKLFNHPNTVATIDFPSRLNNLLANLPIGHNFGIERLINRHSMLPYHIPFQTQEVIMQVRHDMQGNGGARIHGRLGIMASRISYPTWIRYCPICAKNEWESHYDGCYFHRTHQLPGVFICPDHLVPLQDSSLVSYNRSTYYNYVSADSVLSEKDLDILPNPWDEQTFSHLTAIASNTHWLLSHTETASSPSDIRQRYLHQLAERGLATYSGQVFTTPFLNAFISFYTQEFLEFLSCHLDVNQEDNWLLRLVRGSNHVQHPLYHLCLIRFLGHDIESFLQLPVQPAYFGSGPWPCLNAVCTHYLKASILDCNIAFSQDSRRPVGTFRCLCSFVYNRVGPDEFEGDIYKRHRILAFGRTWEDYLENKWMNPNISLRELARNLGVDTRTVNRQAQRLRLPFPRPNNRGGKEFINHTIIHAKFDESKTLENKHKSLWLATLEEHPGLTTTEIRKIVPSTYTWLYRHKQQWLKNHTSSVQAIPDNKDTVNWRHRDIFIALNCTRAAFTLLTSKNATIYLTKTTIARESGHLSNIEKKASKLPLTNNTLNNLVETRLGYAVRRISGIVYRTNCSVLTMPRWKLIRLSGTGRLIDEPQINKALEDAELFLTTAGNTKQATFFHEGIGNDSIIYKLQRTLTALALNDALA